MLESLLGGLVNKEDATKDIIQDALERIASELKCSHKEFFVMIKPKTEEFEFGFWIYQAGDGAPKLIREISLKEILGE